ncbi:carbohydrate ABC transporter permease [Actinoallomurus iriomotensis]|uniref:Sugar ABC transporter permease n=1 Tax=Actinoallomurus iriomotensis TaxID=478107 RepID=A0A9W6REN4_9ACTN|nr:sugar ABC transporter permease [Actinoallomurus iriomotensis]GLY74441.1 sugar ABC transporter permease [Actinoallomurus iriomotensis]
MSGTRARAGDRTRLTDREGFLAWAFLLPTIVYLTALVVAPFGLTVAFAFSRSTSDAPSYRFGGLRGFRAVFGDDVFWRSLLDTLTLTCVSVVLVVVLGTVLAHVLRADLRFRRTVRTLVLLPWTTPVALSAISWRWLLGPAGSPVERVLRGASLLHGGGSPLGRTGPAAVAVVAAHVWRLTPLAAVIVAAGLNAVPSGVWDAARLDGAGFWRRLFGVTVPLTLPVTAVAAVFTAAITFVDMAVVRVLTGGGPHDSTQVLPTLAYLRGVEGGDIGAGAAASLFLLPLFLAGVVVALRAVRRAEAIR